MSVRYDIPLPVSRSTSKKYNWDDLDRRGASKFEPLPDDGRTTNQFVSTLRRSVQAQKKPFKVVCRTVTENEIVGVRVFRL